jgi:hypothetical protein
MKGAQTKCLIANIRRPLHLVQEARYRYGCLTAFRLGLVVGELGRSDECPYDDERGRTSFEAGVASGRVHRQRRLDDEATLAKPLQIVKDGTDPFYPAG